jgi:hypothetical protein
MCNGSWQNLRDVLLWNEGWPLSKRPEGAVLSLSKGWLLKIFNWLDRTFGTFFSIKQILPDFLKTPHLILYIARKGYILFDARKMILHESLIYQFAIPKPDPLSVV